MYMYIMLELGQLVNICSTVNAAMYMYTSKWCQASWQALACTVQLLGMQIKSHHTLYVVRLMFTKWALIQFQASHQN